MSLSATICRTAMRERVIDTLLRSVAAVLVVTIFLVDTLSTLEGAVAVLYVVAVLLVARTSRRADIVVVAGAGITLTLIAYLDTHGLRHVGGQTVRATVSLAAIAISAMLALENQRSIQALSAQATLLDLSHDMIFTRDLGGHIRFWNRSAADIYGWSAAEVAGRRADDLLQTRYLQSREQVESALEATGRWDGILEHTARDGRVLTVESRWVLQRGEASQPWQVLETHTDVTERQAAHLALVRSERRYRRMFNATRIGVAQQDWSAIERFLDRYALHDRERLAAHLAAHPQLIGELRSIARIESLNPAFEAITGWSARQPPSDVSVLLDATDRTFTQSLLAFAAGEPFFEGEAELLRRDGGKVPVLFTITFPVTGDSEGGVLVFVIDIAERKQAQDAMLAAQAELAHAARVATLGELSASIAHEVNQPLMAVVTNGEAGMRWLRRPQPEMHEVEIALDRIVGEGRRASDIVKRLRDFLRNAPPHYQQIDPTALMDDAVELLRHEFGRAEVEVEVGADAQLPVLRGDRIQLEQVLVNLLLNARQAMEQQSTPRRIRLHAARREGDVVEITVADSGPGIASDALARLFVPFYTTKPHGMGMGLAICRTTIEAHGGQLLVESEPGRGCVFRLRLGPHGHG